MIHRVTAAGALKGALFVLLFAAAAGAATATEPAVVSGAVLDAAGAPVAGARLEVDGRPAGATGPDGAFRLPLALGRHRLVVRGAGYHPAARELVVRPGEAPAALTIVLAPAEAFAERLDVAALRAGETAPVTASTLPAERLEELRYGQEMPFLLATTPAVTSYSESGLALGAGYSYFALRGITQTRINMTFDGVPLNDPEESAVYFANFGDFASAVGAVEIQRGVGTSSVGAAAYGGAIHFGSVDLAEERELGVELAAGSYATERASVRYETGRLASGLALYGRYTHQQSDGYREHSGIRQRTAFFGGDWRGEESYLRFFGFSGRERSTLSYYAVEPWLLAENPRYNPMQPEETDAFAQELFYVQGSRRAGTHGQLGAQLYYHGARGALYLFDEPEAKAGRRRIGIDGGTFGALLSASTQGEGWQLTGGLHGYRFERDHFASQAGLEAYRNTGHKQELSGFVKLGRDLGERWHLFTDLQLRHAEFRYAGSVRLRPVSWTFFNPKLGLRYAASERLSLYAALGRAGREPARNDLLEGEDDLVAPVDLEAVRPERVVNAELGAEWRTPRWALAANLYAMEFDDEIAATGEQSELGYAIRRNLPESYRRGIELEGSWRPHPRLELRGTANLSRNRITRWTQALDLYDEAGEWLGSETRTFHGTRPALSPERIFAAAAAWHATRELRLELAARHAGPAQLDNTGERQLATRAYTLVDLTAELAAGRWLEAGNPKLRLQVNNLLDERRVWASGYSYPFLVQEGGGARLDGIPYYYPQAPRHFVLGVEFQF